MKMTFPDFVQIYIEYINTSISNTETQNLAKTLNQIGLSRSFEKFVLKHNIYNVFDHDINMDDSDDDSNSDDEGNVPNEKPNETQNETPQKKAKPKPKAKAKAK